ncbi:MAG: hypothetical protein HQK83_08510 [Fibrobacteria bacterium]|nr:hypothetical protein [Fibrobacteria bacterium]
MTQLGDDLNSSEKSKFSTVGVTRILKAGCRMDVCDFSMGGLKLDSMEMPGRKKPGKEDYQIKIENLEKQVHAKTAEIAQLQKQLSQATQQASQDGYQKGKAEGRQEGEQAAGQIYTTSVEAMQQELESIVGALNHEKFTLIKGYEKDVLAIIMTCIRKVFSELADNYEEAVCLVVRDAISALEAAHSLTIRVNPEDFKVVNTNQSLWMPVSQKMEEVKVEMDEGVSKSSCVIESGASSAEISVNGLLMDIEKQLEAVFNEKFKTEETVEETPQ